MMIIRVIECVLYHRCVCVYIESWYVVTIDSIGLMRLNTM